MGAFKARTLKSLPNPLAVARFAAGAQERVAEEPSSLKRATYYLRPDQIRALKLRAVHEDRNLSDVVREAVDSYLGGR